MTTPTRKAKSSGFTLLEMIVVTAVITILASIAVPRMAQAIQRATEGSARGNLGILRSALSFHYGDSGSYPSSLSALRGPYVSEIPAVKGLAYHLDSAAVRNETSPSDAGGWSYNNNPLSPGYGSLVINCTHVDFHGSTWAQY